MGSNERKVGLEDQVTGLRRDQERRRKELEREASLGRVLTTSTCSSEMSPRMDRWSRDNPSRFKQQGTKDIWLGCKLEPA